MVAAKITMVVKQFIAKQKDVPVSFHSVVTELSDLEICVKQLKPFILGSQQPERSRKEVLSIEQIVILSTSLVLNISELEKLLDSLELSQPIATLAKARWVRNGKSIEILLSRIRASKGSLNLILTIFTW